MQGAAVGTLAGEAYGGYKFGQGLWNYRKGAKMADDMEVTPYRGPGYKRNHLGATVEDGSAVRIQSVNPALCLCKVTYGTARRNFALMQRYVLNKMTESRITRFQSVTDGSYSLIDSTMLSVWLDSNRHSTLKETHLPFYIFRLNTPDVGVLSNVGSACSPCVMYRLTMRDGDLVKYSDTAANNKQQFYWKLWPYGIVNNGVKGAAASSLNLYRQEWTSNVTGSIDAFSHDWSRIKLLLKGQYNKSVPTGKIRYGIMSMPKAMAPTRDFYNGTTETKVSPEIVDGNDLQRSDAYWRQYWAGKVNCLASQGLAPNCMFPKYYGSKHACLETMTQTGKVPMELVDYVFNNGSFYNLTNFETLIDNVTNPNTGLDGPIDVNHAMYPTAVNSNDQTPFLTRYTDERFFYVACDNAIVAANNDPVGTDGHSASFDIIIRNSLRVVPT